MIINLMVAESHEPGVEIESWDGWKNLDGSDSLSDFEKCCKTLQPNDYVEYMLTDADLENKTYMLSLRKLVELHPEHFIDAMPRDNAEHTALIYFHVSDSFEKLAAGDKLLGVVQEVYLPLDISGKPIL